MTSLMPSYQPAVPDPNDHQPHRAGRVDTAVLTELATRLTERDRWLIRLLWDHHVFTIHQIAQLAFGSDSRARARMIRLTRLGVVERFRPLLPPGHGSAPQHYIIGQGGARVLAAERDIPYGELGYRRDRIHAWAVSSRLSHLIGVNGLFTALFATARDNPPAHLVTWWPEQRCIAKWGGYARPDGYGRWREGGDEVDFWVEYDTGTEPLGKVAAKLDGYADLAREDGVLTPVLIWTTTAKRETNLHRQLRGAPVPVATATPAAIRDHRQGPAGPIWLPAGQPAKPRLRLITLARYAQSDHFGGDDEQR
jgi:hypothetical protein